MDTQREIVANLLAYASLATTEKMIKMKESFVFELGPAFENS
jgi:hypothetical protein